MPRPGSRSKTKQDPVVVEMNAGNLQGLHARSKAKDLEDGDFALICLLVEAYQELFGLLENQKISLARLRKILFGASTEKTKGLVGEREKTSTALSF